MMFLIYSPHIINRLLYVLNYIFNEQFGIEYQITNNKDEFLKSNIEQKIIYSNEEFDNAVFIYASNFLFETGVEQNDINASKINNQFFLFKHEKPDAIGFDVFAATFYLLSRYEEYYNLPKDKFDNYSYENSVLYKHSVLHIPVVEQWLELLKACLKNKFPSLQFKNHKASYILSFDIDVAYAYRNRTLNRIFGGFIKKLVKLQFKEFTGQLLTLLHLKRDMYDTFDYIQSTIKNKKAIFFFNMGTYGKFDKNPSYKNKKFSGQIQAIHKKNIVGIHPSYASNSDKELFIQEKSRLEKIIAQPITQSRQHYLKLKLPSTYQTLIENGITEDFTIGYHDAYGFRAGTCKPFLFFDLEKNESTTLTLYPFTIMEGTFNDVLKLSTNEAKAIILNLISTIKKYNGVFIPLWHNSTLSNKEHWKGWRKVFEYILGEIDANEFENFINT